MRTDSSNKFFFPKSITETRSKTVPHRDATDNQSYKFQNSCEGTLKSKILSDNLKITSESSSTNNILLVAEPEHCQDANLTSNPFSRDSLVIETPESPGKRPEMK